MLGETREPVPRRIFSVTSCETNKVIPCKIPGGIPKRFTVGNHLKCFEVIFIYEFIKQSLKKISQEKITRGISQGILERGMEEFLMKTMY